MHRSSQRQEGHVGEEENFLREENSFSLSATAALVSLRRMLCFRECYGTLETAGPSIIEAR